MHYHSEPKWDEGDLANRMLVDPPYKEGKHVIDVRPSGLTREEITEKLRVMTTGRFFRSGQWIQFEDEKDYFVFRLVMK